MDILIHKAKQRQEYLNQVSKPFLEQATWTLNTSPRKILVKPGGVIRYIYPFGTLRALVHLRLLYRQVTENFKGDQFTLLS